MVSSTSAIYSKPKAPVLPKRRGFFVCGRGAPVTARGTALS